MFTVVTGVGYTGRRVMRLLPPDSVTGLSRSPQVSGVLSFDLDTATQLPIEPPAPFSVVYTVPPAGDPPDTRLERFLSMAAPARLVYLSTTGVYGDCGGRTVTEDSALRPSSERAGRRVAAEQLLRQWADDGGCELVILRVPGIYGPGRLGVERIRAGVPVLDEDSANPGNRIHVDDLARCCIAGLSAPPGVYNVGDGDHRSTTAFTGEVARQLGLAEPPQITLADARKLYSKERLSFLADSRVVDTRRMREILGVMPLYADPAAGIRASLAEAGDQV